MMRASVPTTVDTAIEGVRIQSKPVQTREIFDIGGSDIGGSRACGTNKPRMLPFSDLALCRGFVQTEGLGLRSIRPPAVRQTFKLGGFAPWPHRVRSNRDRSLRWWFPAGASKSAYPRTKWSLYTSPGLPEWH